ncbi:hypothetical protein CsSME_00005506 [Camellia sinensis var. sinensis]
MAGVALLEDKLREKMLRWFGHVQQRLIDVTYVLDSSASNPDEQQETILQVLEKIGVSEEKIENMIEI